MLLCFCHIKGAMKLNPVLETCSKKDLEVHISKWLTGARDRDGRRVERRKVEKRRLDLQPPLGPGDNDDTTSALSSDCGLPVPFL